MLNHTTAKGLQEEMVRRARRRQGTKDDEQLTQVSINVRRVAAAIAAIIAALAIVAANTLGPAEAPATNLNEFQGGTSGVPLHAN